MPRAFSPRTQPVELGDGAAVGAGGVGLGVGLGVGAGLEDGGADGAGVDGADDGPGVGVDVGEGGAGECDGCGPGLPDGAWVTAGGVFIATASIGPDGCTVGDGRRAEVCTPGAG
jgi:hypothetical protein